MLLIRHHGQAKKYAALSTSGNRGSDAFDGPTLMDIVQRSDLSRGCLPVVTG